MSKKLHFYQWRENGYSGPWFSFDTDPEFRNGNAYSQKYCTPCMQNLLMRILSARDGEPIDLGYAWQCWKPVMVLNGVETPKEARGILEANQDLFLPEEMPISGKIGGSKEPGTQALIMYARDIESACVLEEGLRDFAARAHPDSEILTAMACEPIHGLLFGDWRDWKKETPLRCSNDEFWKAYDRITTAMKIE